MVGMQTYPDSVKISYGGFPKRLEKEVPHDQAINTQLWVFTQKPPDQLIPQTRAHECLIQHRAHS